jgi:hypothetical protein
MKYRILSGLCVILSIAACGEDSSESKSGSSCKAVCDCVGEQGGDKAACTSDCSDIVSQGGDVKAGCEAALDSAGLSECKSNCAGFSSGEAPGAGGASGAGGGASGSGGATSSADADCETSSSKIAERRVALGCPNVSGIETDCKPALAAKPQCADEFHAMVACVIPMADSVYECNGDGKADLKDGVCQSERDAFDACMGS